MAWTYNGTVIRPGRSWSNDEGTRFATNWNTIWSDSDKVDAGMVYVADPLPYDKVFYWSYGVEKNVDSLKATFTDRVEVVKKSLLQNTNEDVIFALEDSIGALDSDVRVFRSDVRSRATTLTVAIASINTFDQMRTAYYGVLDSDGNYSDGVLNVWPKDPTIDSTGL